MRGERTRWWLKSLVIIGIMILIGGVSQWKMAHARQRPTIQPQTTALITTASQQISAVTPTEQINRRTGNPVLSARIGHFQQDHPNSITARPYRINRRAYNVTLIGGVMVGSVILWLGYHWWRRR